MSKVNTRLLTVLGVATLFLTYSVIAASAPPENQKSKDAGKGARLESLKGKVVRCMKARLRGQEGQHQLILLKIQDGQRVFVDIGRVEATRKLKLQKGDQITVRGKRVSTATFPILIAHRFSDKDDTYQIANRSAGTSPERISGKVTRTREVQRKGQKTTGVLAMVKTSDGRNVVVDLGPRSKLEGNQPKVGQQITAQGRKYRVYLFPVLVARQVSAKEQTIDIRRPNASNRQGKAGVRQVRVSGTVDRMKRVDLPEKKTKHVVVQIKTKDGRKVLADLGPLSNFQDRNKRIHQGEQITAQGPMLQLGKYRVMKVTQFTGPSGKQVSIERPTRPQGDRQSDTGRYDARGESSNWKQGSTRRLAGQVADLRRLTPRGQDRRHLVAVVRSGDRQTLVDLGPADRLSDVDLSRGDQLKIQGREVRSGSRTMIRAEQVSANGETIQIQQTGSGSRSDTQNNSR